MTTFVSRWFGRGASSLARECDVLGRRIELAQRFAGWAASERDRCSLSWSGKTAADASVFVGRFKVQRNWATCSQRKRPDGDRPANGKHDGPYVDQIRLLAAHRSIGNGVKRVAVGR